MPPKKVPRYADIGFGKGELIEEFAKPNRIIQGIESPIQRNGKRTIDLADLNYEGFEKWVGREPNNSYTGLNFGLFLQNYVNDTIKKRNPKWHQLLEKRVQREAAIKIPIPKKLIKKHEDEKRKMLESALRSAYLKLVPGGRIRIVEAESVVEDTMAALKNAGFVAISPFKYPRGDLLTYWEDRIHNWTPTTVIIAAKPRQKRRTIPK